MIPDREPDHIRLLQCTKLDKNNNKWWKIRYWAAERVSEVTFGRGSFDCSKPSIKTGYEAVDVWNKKPLEKLKKGYVELALAQSTDTTEYDDDTSLPDEIKKRAASILEAASESINSYLNTTVDKLSADQIDAGRAVLQEIVTGQSKLSDKEMIALVERYYNLIPSRLPAKIKPLEVTQTLIANAFNEEDKLQQLSAAIKGLNVKRKGGSILDQIGCSILEVTDSKTIKAIKDKFNQTKSWGTIKEIWEVVIPDERKNYEACNLDNVELLYHGTAARNVRHILRTGLIINKNAANGSLFGRGIYFADSATKSLNYTSAHKKDTYMFLADVKLGKQYTTTECLYNGLPDSKNYHSVFAQKGKRIDGVWNGSLANNEYIVYTPQQQTIKYILVVN